MPPNSPKFYQITNHVLWSIRMLTYIEHYIPIRSTDAFAKTLVSAVDLDTLVEAVATQEELLGPLFEGRYLRALKEKSIAFIELYANVIRIQNSCVYFWIRPVRSNPTRLRYATYTAMTGSTSVSVADFVKICHPKIQAYRLSLGNSAQPKTRPFMDVSELIAEAIELLRQGKFVTIELLQDTMETVPDISVTHQAILLGAGYGYTRIDNFIIPTINNL